MRLTIWAAAALMALAIGAIPAEENGRAILLRAMKERPGDPWPRGSGRVLLGEPGSPEGEKAYLEPGGAFSPVPGSFGISLWITDTDGRVRTTSETVPLAEMTQQIHWTEDEK